MNGAETITVDEARDREREHYEDILLQHKRVAVASARFGMAKASADAAKKEWELERETLLTLIHRGPDNQMRLDFKDGDEWRSIPLKDIDGIGDSKLKQLAEAGINTLGDITDYTEEGHDLTDIKGIGPESSEHIANVLTEFWAENEHLIKDEPADEEGDEETED